MRVSFRQNLLLEEGGFAMKRNRFSVEQIVAVLKEAEVGVPVARKWKPLYASAYFP